MVLGGFRSFHVLVTTVCLQGDEITKLVHTIKSACALLKHMPINYSMHKLGFFVILQTNIIFGIALHF